jgi:hypothetical protein
MYLPSCITPHNAPGRADLASRARIAKIALPTPLHLQMDANAPGGVIEVFPAEALAVRPRLFAALSAAFLLRFEPGSADGGSASAAGELHFTPSDRFAKRPGPAPGGRALVLGERAWSGALAGDVAFGEEADRRLRDLVISDPLDGPELDLEPGETILAGSGRRPVWTRAGPPRPPLRLPRRDDRLDRLPPRRRR